jgi:hypothetical protein
VFNPRGDPSRPPLYFEPDSRGLGGIVAARHDSIGSRGKIKGFGCVSAVVACGMRLLARILGSNDCNPFLRKRVNAFGPTKSGIWIPSWT